MSMALNQFILQKEVTYVLGNELKENKLINSKKVILVQGNLSKNIHQKIKSFVI